MSAYPSVPDNDDLPVSLEAYISQDSGNQDYRAYILLFQFRHQSCKLIT
jgi:hypothetical protein